MFFQDAHEFLSLCLDLLRDEVVRINKSLPSLTNDIVTMSSQDLAIAGIGHEEQENWPPKSMLLSSEMDCPVTSNFQFTVRHTIMCTGCGFKLDQPEKMLILSLFLPEPKELVFENALNKYLFVTQDFENNVAVVLIESDRILQLRFVCFKTTVSKII